MRIVVILDELFVQNKMLSQSTDCCETHVSPLMYYIISTLQFFATNLRKNLYVYYTQKQNYVLLYIGLKQNNWQFALL